MGYFEDMKAEAIEDLKQTIRHNGWEIEEAA